MTQKGPHTWDIIIQYHQCPKCGYINESREDYEYRLGKYQKDIRCERCGNNFTLTKRARPSMGPFFGEGDHAEVDWK